MQMQLVSNDTFDFRICLTMTFFVFFKESRSIVFKIENFEVHPCTSAFLPVFIAPFLCSSSAPRSVYFSQGSYLSPFQLFVCVFA